MNKTLLLVWSFMLIVNCAGVKTDAHNTSPIPTSESSIVVITDDMKYDKQYGVGNWGKTTKCSKESSSLNLEALKALAKADLSNRGSVVMADTTVMENDQYHTYGSAKTSLSFQVLEYQVIQFSDGDLNCTTVIAHY